MTPPSCPAEAKPALSKGASRRMRRWLQRHHLDDPGHLVIYPCGTCHRYHLGHVDPQRKKAS